MTPIIKLSLAFSFIKKKKKITYVCPTKPLNQTDPYKLLIAFSLNKIRKRVLVLQNHPNKQTFTNKLRLHI